MASDVQRRRRSIRLDGYDYSQDGAYFITICTQDRACLFGEIVDDEIRLNDAGRMVMSQWDAQSNRFSTVRLGTFVVMPNHIHGILWIESAAGAITRVAPAPIRPGATTTHGATTRVAPTAPTIGDIVGAFKSLTTVAYVRGVEQSGWVAFRGKLWQRNYYEHIIRDDGSLSHICQYIIDNPAQWAMDRENPKAPNYVA